MSFSAVMGVDGWLKAPYPPPAFCLVQLWQALPTAMRIRASNSFPIPPRWSANAVGHLGRWWFILSTIFKISSIITLSDAKKNLHLTCQTSHIVVLLHWQITRIDHHTIIEIIINTSLKSRNNILILDNNKPYYTMLPFGILTKKTMPSVILQCRFSIFRWTPLIGTNNPPVGFSFMGI